MKQIEGIKEKANYCLNCKNRPCQKACPMQTNIPGFIEEIKNDNIENAYKILMDNNIFSSICSFICPQENQCEGSCTRGIKEKPVLIGELEQFVNCYAKEKKLKYNIEKKEDINIKVAIIGSGPASLSCAYELAKEGVSVTIFEKEESLGGILRYGIPDYRLDKKELDSVINKIINLGIEVKTKCEFGKDIHINDLKNDGYSYIFLGIGAGMPTKYSLGAGEIKGVYDSNVFLKEYNQGNYIRNLENVIVIGGGNVAMDCARSAKRMGATKVSIVYRRNIEDMPARKIEIKETLEDGIEIIPCTKVISAEEKDGYIQEIECIKTKVIEGKAVDIENSNFKMKTNCFVFAIGLLPEKDFIEREGLYLENGLVKINEKGETNIDRVYAGGDLTESKSTVCRAIAAGKKSAKSILDKIL